MNKLRPVDQLRQLLIDCQGPDAEEVKAFFRLHKIEQACATCLILACTRLASDQQVADWAKMAFFLYGGEAQYTYGGGGLSGDRPMMPSNIGPSGGGGIGAGPNNTIPYSPSAGGHHQSFASFPTPMPGMHPTQTSTPMPAFGSQSLYHPTSSMPGFMQDVTFSGKHNGICLYMARILRPIWEMMVTKDFPCQTPEGMKSYLTCNFASEDLGFVLENMRELSDFVDFNSKFDTGPPDTGGMGGVPFTPHQYMMGHIDDQTRRKMQAEAQKMEKLSLQHLQELIHRVEEVLGLLKVLVDHQFHVLADTLTQDQQNQLKSLTFKQFVITGRDLCGSLINCLINRYLDDNATIDAISSRLREICPSLYSTDDATCSKANELLQAAKISQNLIERRTHLTEALKLYKNVSQPLQLSEVCSQFASVHFYEGIVDLCLTMANKRDPQKLALHFYNNDEPPEDMQGVTELMARKECYKCITETLGYLLSASVTHPQGPAPHPFPGHPLTPDTGSMSADDAEHYKTEVFRLALKTEDELFHVSLYDWLFSMSLTDKLLEIQSPYLEPYLKRRAGFQAGDISALDLLWKYYEKNENYPAAARILSRLSERHGIDSDLQRRIEYLSRSIMCAKSSSSRATSASEGEFLHELEEKMEVARLQMSVVRALSQESGHDVQQALASLDADLLDITKLYEDYADRFDLSECKLAIVHCAGLYDGALVENLWRSIIDKEFETTRTSAASVRVRNISNKLCVVGKIYIKAERYFPYAFIVKYLEQRTCELQLDCGWVHQLMLDIGVPPLRVLELYDRMFKSRDPYWLSLNRPLHLLYALHSLLSKLTNNPALIPIYERRPFSTLGLDFIAGYLVELQAISSVDMNVRTLVSNFKALQAKMERL